MNTAVDEDQIIPRNSCRVRGADKESPAERPKLTVAQVYELAWRMPKRFRVLILLTAFASYTADRWDALIFTGEKGGALRRPNFNQRVKWTATVAAMGLKGLHFHDLRHAGNTWAAKAGTSTKDLMTRMGHDDMRAALIYQHASSEADQAIADRLSGLVDQHRKDGTKPVADEREEGDDGAAGVLVPTG